MNRENKQQVGSITIVGLGAGPFGFLTIETLEVLEQATKLYLRTAVHPAVAGLREKQIGFESFDDVYNSKASFEEVYQTITDRCLAAAQAGEKLVYAVPGSPLVAEQTVLLIRKQAQQQGVPLTILPGMSFLEVLYARLAIDPLEGLVILDAANLDMSLAKSGTALVITQLYDRQIASDTKLSLMDAYPDDYEVTVVRNLGLADETICQMPLYKMDRIPVIDHLTSLFVPAVQLKSTTFSLTPLLDVMAKLRSPTGCVWDIEQTHSSLRRHLVEEVYEVLEAIDLEDCGLLCEELGDLLMQIVFHARMAEEFQHFSMQDVIDGVTEKLIRRHPHVFGDISVRNAAEVVVNWDKIKQQEKTDRSSVLDGVPKGLPALMRAFKLQSKAGKVGFDWSDLAPVWDKLYEELDEFKEAIASGDREAMEDEFGDVLFSAVNVARFLKLEPETSLNHTNNKFVRRFQFIEKRLAAEEIAWDKMRLESLDLLWKEAKGQEKH
ncbi:tetrapyrrole methylase family protein/MazG family protein [Sporomusaceae bacterium BoRhaA]|nr:tetrapyrrole methylase family protein/MazG family protein [Pelorhabdus rhamnosifermentans]